MIGFISQDLGCRNRETAVEQNFAKEKNPKQSLLALVQCLENVSQVHFQAQKPESK